MTWRMKMIWRKMMNWKMQMNENCWITMYLLSECTCTNIMPQDASRYI